MITLRPGKIEGTVRAPSSKSLTQRAILLSAVAEGESEIKYSSRCDDAAAALRVAEALGAAVTRRGDHLLVRGGGDPRGGIIKCGESGFCMRAAPPLAALSGVEFELVASGSLSSRPVGMVADALGALGVECVTDGGFPPIKIKRPLRGGILRVDARETSQLLSGLLMALPICGGDSQLTAAGLNSAPYVSMTVEMVGLFGGRVECDPQAGEFSVRGSQRYRAAGYSVEGDWSGAAFLLVAGAVAGDVRVSGLRSDSLQGDRKVLDALEMAGAKLAWERGDLRVTSSGLRPFEFDCTDCPDLFPPLAVLASACGGVSKLRGTERLRHKESDRAAALALELGRLGAKIRTDEGTLIIEGGCLRGGEVDSHGDHRIAMACAVSSLISSGDVLLEGESCVAKSYPGFFKDLEHLKGAQRHTPSD